MKDQQQLNQKMIDVQQKIISEGRSKETVEKEGRIISQLEERRNQEEILWK